MRPNPRYEATPGKDYKGKETASEWSVGIAHAASPAAGRRVIQPRLIIMWAYEANISLVFSI
jgi:hypothetical protein